MKRFTAYITLLTLLFTVSCVQPQPVPNDSLSILSGVTNNQLIFDGVAGSTANFSISSKLPWQLLDTPGIEFSPASGDATPEGSKCVITATVKDANNSLEMRKIGDVIFRLANTRFTGITAHQRPQINVNNLSITIAAEQNKYSSFAFECKTTDCEIIAEGDIVCTQPKYSSSNRYSFTVAATKDNLSDSDKVVGHITFVVSGTKQREKIEVVQQAAFSFDRSRIVVNGTVGAESIVTVNTPFNFDVTCSSTAIKATKLENQQIRLTIVEANNGTAERKLGVLTISLSDNPACKSSIEIWQRRAVAEKSMLFYFLGTSLKSYYESNLKMVEDVLKEKQTNDCRVVAFLQSSQNAGQVVDIYYDSGLDTIIREEISSYELPVKYTEQMVSNILKDMIKQAPATEYGLFIGSHGKGWIPKEQSRAGYSTFETAPSYDIWVPAPGAAMVRHIGDNANTQINTTELAAAIESTECHLNYIIFDACYMSNIESIYDLRSCADYILASPCEVMANGMPYNKIIPIMASSKDVKSRLDDSAKEFVDYYKLKYDGIYSSACSAVINCSQIENLALATKRANSSLQSIDPNTVQPYDGISASRNPTHIFFDIEDYILKSCTDSAAVDAFCKQLALTVSGQHHTKSFYSAYNNNGNPINHYSGVTTSAPIVNSPTSAYIDEWQQTAWYKATH